MSRRLIIGILVLLIVGILGGTVAFVMQRLQSGEEQVSQVPSESGNLNPAQEGQPNIVNPSSDDDADGLTNAEESIWGTDPKNADTDGDSYQDGAEVTAEHNPNVPGPNDKLPSGFSPNRDLQPLDVAPLQPDKFFVENLDLDPLRDRDLTAEYNKKYPEAERTQETLVAFAKEQPIVTRLPLVREDSITVTKENSTLTIGHYLDSAGDLDKLMNRTLISDAFIDMFESNDVSTVYGLAISAREYQNELKQVPVPPEAVQLHRLLLSTSELLVHTYTLIATWQVDPAKAMVGVHQLDTIDQTYMPGINQEIARLEAVKQQLQTTADTH